MDKAFKNEFATSINLLGASFYAPINEQDQSEVLPYLKQAKLKKFLSKQDRLAIIGFANLLNQFKGDRENLLKKSGLYLCVGYIPFEENTIRSLAKASQAEGAFSMDAFSSNGISSINPLTTFKCLPNMPAYHITSTFDLQGTSFTTYPGTGQLYQAIEMAMLDLEMNKIDYAFVGAVCDQDNFLVKSFHNRINQNCKLIDAAGFCCLTNQKLINEHSWVETPWELKNFQIAYQSFDPLDTGYHKSSDTQNHYGSADFFHSYQMNQSKDFSQFHHQYSSIDGFKLESNWQRKVKA